MLTLFDLLRLLGFVGGAVLGACCGWKWYGMLGSIIGGPAGFLLGGFIGQLPLIVALKSVSHKFDQMTSDQLRHHLRDSNCVTPNIVLLELQRRGEDIIVELPYVYSLLTSDDASRRTFGWAALTSAYPDLVPLIPDYNPTRSMDECRQACMPLENVTGQ